MSYILAELGRKQFFRVLTTTNKQQQRAMGLQHCYSCRDCYAYSVNENLNTILTDLPFSGPMSTAQKA